MNDTRKVRIFVLKLRMLKKKLKLEPKSIPTVAKRGKRFVHELFEIRVWYDSTLQNAHFAIVVSTKVDKRAVVRNRIKRKLRVVLTEAEVRGLFKIGDYVVIAKSNKLRDLQNDYILDQLKDTLATN